MPNTPPPPRPVPPWSQVRRVLAAVIERPDAERPAWLDRLCAGQPELRAEVERFLTAHDHAGSALDPDSGAPTSAVMEASGPLLIGELISGYRILRLIGAGGMGAVYQVSHADGQQYALKVLGGWTIPGETRASAKARMEDETRVLAGLAHPGICAFHRFGAHVLRSGATTPYLILELVRGGRAITEYAQHRGLGVPDRVALLADACEAVGHAHARGVVHRDLKPDNLLVDERGHVKVIDFGLARAPGLTPEAERAGVFPGTLRYMSPEQVDDLKPSADARSDVYALGVVMHELLGRRPPYELGATVDSARKAIRSATPNALRARPRDLSAIAAHALNKDPAARYPDADAMARDLRRVLRREPAVVRPKPWWSRLLSGLKRKAPGG